MIYWVTELEMDNIEWIIRQSPVTQDPVAREDTPVIGSAELSASRALTTGTPLTNLHNF